MIISGIQKTSLIDYPRKICTVLFTRGCNFSCGFCHNPELVKRSLYLKPLDNNEVLSFLAKRRRTIDAVTITGGEPTLHRDLPQFIKQIKDLGYLIKLDTNGSNPDMIQQLLSQKLITYFAMDIKNSPHKYRQTTNRTIDIKSIKKSVKLIMNSGINYEFRTTVVPGLHTEKDFEAIGKWLAGAKRYYLQAFRPAKTLDPDFGNIKPFTQKQIAIFKEILEKHSIKAYIR